MWLSSYLRKVFFVALLFVFLTPISAYAADKLIGYYSIPLSEATSENNAYNAVLALSFLNDKVLEPNQIFSFNETVGMRTVAKGFISGEIATVGSKEYSIGGGICMSASTLHQAVKSSGLEVIERHNHVSDVGYLPIGEDAAIWWNRQDYKFENNKENPIHIKAVVNNENLEISIVEILPYTKPEQKLEFNLSPQAKKLMHDIGRLYSSSSFMRIISFIS